MTVEEQLIRDIEDYSKNPYNKYIVDRAKKELAELKSKVHPIEKAKLEEKLKKSRNNK